MIVLLFVHFIFCALLHTVLAQDEAQITREIWPEIQNVGETGYLNCTITRQQLTNKVFWIHKDSATILTSDDRVEVDDKINEVVDGYTKYDVVKSVIGDMTTYMLIVRRLVLTDSGTYTCQLNIQSATFQPSKDGQLIVLIPPTLIQGKTTQTKTVNEFESVNLTCDATGFPTPNISWVRVNGKPLPPPYNRFAYRGKVLQLTNVQGADRGMYRCVADNNVRPPATYDATLYVNFRPQARAVQSSYGQAQNRQFDLIIECILAGYPVPDMQWYQIVQGGLNPIIDDDKHVLNQLLSHGQTQSISEVWYQMLIINLQANDYGTYVCLGKNLRGEGSATIQVYETSECQGPLCMPEGGFQGAAVRTSLSTTSFVIAVTLLSLSVTTAM